MTDDRGRKQALPFQILNACKTIRRLLNIITIYNRFRYRKIVEWKMVEWKNNYLNFIRL